MAAAYTDTELNAIALWLKDGLSATRIAQRFSALRGSPVSRNAIIGIVHRNTGLRAIGFANPRGGRRARPGEMRQSPRREGALRDKQSCPGKSAYRRRQSCPDKQSWPDSKRQTGRAGRAGDGFRAGRGAGRRRYAILACWRLAARTAGKAKTRQAEEAGARAAAGLAVAAWPSPRRGQARRSSLQDAGATATGAARPPAACRRHAVHRLPVRPLPRPARSHAGGRP